MPISEGLGPIFAIRKSYLILSGAESGCFSLPETSEEQSHHPDSVAARPRRMNTDTQAHS
jgi:hypothetical protein